MTLSIYDLLKYIVPPIAFVVACLVGVPYVKSRPVSYQASAKIWIQAQFPSSGGENNPQSGLYVPLATFFNSPIKTAAELIRSDVVLDQSVDFLKKSIPDEAGAPSLDELREGVKTEEVKDTDVLIVRYTDRDPKRAFLVLEGVLEGFLKLNSIQSSASALRSRQFLEQQLVVAKKNLSTAREELRRFQTFHGKTDIPQETLSTINKMAQMEMKVEETRSEIARYRQMVAYLESIPPEERVTIGSASATDDPVIKGLQARQSEIQLELTQLSPRLRETHPMIVSLKSASEQLSKAIDNRLTAYRNGGAPKDIALVPGNGQGLASTTMQTESARSLVSARKELSGLESVLRSRIADVAELKIKIKQLPEQHTQFAELKHNEEHCQSMMSEIENRLDSARQIESVASGVTNIQIIDRPRIPTIPSGPGSTILFAATALLGAGLATGSFFLIQLLDPSVSRARQIAFPNFPIIAAMGSLTAASSQKQANASEFDRLRLALTPKLAQAKMVAVLSSKPYEGKTVTVAGLAKSFAAAGQHALIVEDVSQGPYLHESLGIQAPLSPTHFKDKGLEGIVREVSPRVSLISTSSEDFAWDSETGSSLLSELEKHFDVVLFDTDPLSRSAKSLSLLRYKALPLLLVRMKRTSKTAISILVRQLSLQGIRFGVIAVWDANQAAILDTVSTMQPMPQSAESERQEEDIWV